MIQSIESVQSTLQQHWIRINTGALASNFKVLRDEIGPDVRLMAVVKANGYGHGAAAAAAVFRDAGADFFGVTTLDEALQVIDGGIDSHKTPILLFAPVASEDQALTAIDHGLHLTVCDGSHLEIVRAAEEKSGVSASLHLKIDTGMGRLGLGTKQALEVAKYRASWSGIYTHFARAGEKDQIFTRHQLDSFNAFCVSCKTAGVETGLRHCANSAAALRIPEARLDMVRIGTSLYGQMPSAFVPRPAGLKAETFQAQAQVVFVHKLEVGQTVGYGSEFVAKRQMWVAVVPIGFADGFGVAPTSLYSGWRGIKQMLADRSPGRAAYVTINNQRAAVLGRVAMQMIVVDITDHKGDVAVGDVADIPMRRLSASAGIPRRYESW